MHRLDGIRTSQDLLAEPNRLRIVAARRRGKARLSLQDLVAGCGVPKSSLANYLSGRTRMPADVLDRLILVLGVEPSSSPAQAQAWERVTESRLPTPGAATATTWPFDAPRQLPHDIHTFVGRAREIRTITRLVADAQGPVVVITGPPGAGKWALAVQVANVLAPGFPDGQLYINMRGSTPDTARCRRSKAWAGYCGRSASRPRPYRVTPRSAPRRCA